MPQIGDTFRLSNTSIEIHLHIIISNPSQHNNKIVTVNFTSWRDDKDQSCIVEVGEHSFIKVRSCVDYRRNTLISLDTYEQCLKSGDIVSYDPVSEILLKRIIDGARISPYISYGSRQILADQGLINNE